MEKPEGLVRKAEEEGKWAGLQNLDREGQVGPQQPVFLPESGASGGS